MLNKSLAISFLLIIWSNCFGFVDSILADSAEELNSKAIDFIYCGDFQNAERYFKSSLNIKKKICDSPHSISLARAYNNIGLLCLKKWEYDSALTLFLKAEEIFRQIDDSQLYLAILLSNKGKIYENKGDFYLCEQYYYQSLETLRNIFTREGDLRRAETINRLGLLKLRQKETDEAIKIFKKGILEYNPSNPKITLQNLYENLANAYFIKKEYSKSLKNYRIALELVNYSNKLGPSKETYIYQKQSIIYAEKGDYKKAFKLLNKSSSTLFNLPVDSSYHRQLYTDYATVHKIVKNHDSALYYYQKALALSCNGSFTNIFETPPANNFKNLTLGIAQLKLKAECFVNWNITEPDNKKLTTALNCLEVATQLIDKARNSYLSVESKLMIAENETSIYEMGLHCASQLFNNTGEPKFLDKAFYFSEKSKSSVLLSVLQDEKAKSFSTIPDTLLRKEQSLKKEIAFYKERIYEESLKPSPDSNKLRIWNGYLFSHTKDQNELQNLLEKEYNDYYFLKYNQQNTTPEEIQKILPKNTTIIEYSLTGTNLYIFCIQTKCLNLKRIKIDSSFLIHTNKYLNQFRDFSFVNQSKTVYRDLNKSGHELYKKLIGPLQDEIANDHLIIIPDDLLSYIPFESLMTREDSMNIDSYKQLPFLIKKHPVSYSYSSSLLNESWASKGRKMHNRLLSIAPDYKPVNTESLIITKASHKGYRDNLHPIPYARKEAELVSSLTLGRSLIGIQATEKAFLSNAVNYDILHLAMHTIIDDNNPLYSKLVFYDENYRSDEGLLTTNEIFSLKLKARMAVLSSCSSGEGEFKKGEGVLSLARGFFYAGCPSLIMTLWQVDDESGLMLMRLYYKYLIKGYSKPVALQKAKLEYLNTVPNQKKHPFYWSTYICIGNPSPIYFPRRYSYLGGVLIIFLLVLILAIQKKKKTKISLKEPDL